MLSPTSQAETCSHQAPEIQAGHVNPVELEVLQERLGPIQVILDPQSGFDSLGGPVARQVGHDQGKAGINQRFYAVSEEQAAGGHAMQKQQRRALARGANQGLFATDLEVMLLGDVGAQKVSFRARSSAST